jgi:hypothetical protein
VSDASTRFGEAVSSAALEASRAFMQVAQKTTTLYELSADFLRVLGALESDADEDLEIELDHIAGQIAQKAEAISGLVAQLDGMAAMRKAEAQRLRDRASADERHAARLREYLLRHMQEIGTERIDTARFTVAIRQNPPAVEVLEELLVPDDFKREVTTVSVDKRAILDHFKAQGEIVPGVEIVRRPRLDIR